VASKACSFLKVTSWSKKAVKKNSILEQHQAITDLYDKEMNLDSETKEKLLEELSKMGKARQDPKIC
jgi:hypothetical protein